MLLAFKKRLTTAITCAGHKTHRAAPPLRSRRQVDCVVRPQLHICSQWPSTHRPMRQPKPGNGFRPHDNDGALSQICSQYPLTHLPIRQPRLGSGFKPQERVGELSQICSQAPSTHLPIRQPSLGNGFKPQVRVPCARVPPAPITIRKPRAEITIFLMK